MGCRATGISWHRSRTLGSAGGCCWKEDSIITSHTIERVMKLSEQMMYVKALFGSWLHTQSEYMMSTHFGVAKASLYISTVDKYFYSGRTWG